MSLRLGLRIRTIVAHVTLGAALSASLAIAVTLLLEDMEERFLHVTMIESLDLLVQIGRRQEQPELPATESLKAYVLTQDGDTTLPEQLLGLGPGIHDLDSSEEELLVAVRDDGSRRYVLTYDETPIVRLETYFTIGGLILGIVGFTFAALWLGSWMSGRVLKPVISLARQINAIGDEVSRPLLRGPWGDDEIGDLARAFEHYAERIGQFVERERAFTSDVSHELRNPIMSASSALELLLDEPDHAPMTRERLQRLDRALDRMGETVDVFLALGRESRPADAEVGLMEVDVESIVRAVIDRYLHVARDKELDVRLETSASSWTVGSASAVSVVLENIIGNAVRHTSSGRVDVKIRGSGVTVTDTGPGIPKDEYSRIFERGFRGSNASPHGSGLGLSIVSRICDHWGWRVTVEPAHPCGTMVHLHLTAAGGKT